MTQLLLDGSGFDRTYTFTYDGNGNILSVAGGGYTTSYVYDSQNQLVRENNQKAGKTWIWNYDNAGNITSKQEYDYTTGTLGVELSNVNYGYGYFTRKDLLTSYNGFTFSHK